MNTSCKELKRIARANLTHRFSTPMGALLVAGIIPLAIELPFSMIQGEHPSLMQNIAFYAAEFLIALISYTLNAGVTLLHLNLARKKPYSVSMVFYGFQNRPDRFILAGLIELVIVLVGLIPFFVGISLFRTMDSAASYAVLFGLACVSLVLCTIIALNICLMVYFVIEQPDLPLFDCLKRSLRTMKGHKGRLLYIYLSFIGLQLFNALSLGIGSLWVGPYQDQTMANFYLNLIGEIPPAQQAAPGSGNYQSFNQYI